MFFHDVLCDFIARMNRHIVEDHRIRPFQESGVDLIRHHHVDDLVLLFGIVWVGKEFHVDPSVRIDTIYLGNDFLQVFFRNIRRQFFIMTCRSQFVVKIGRYVGNLAERRQAVHHAAHLGDDFAERIIRVVLGPDIEYFGFKMAGLFVERQHISQGLRRVERIVTTVDDRYGGVLHKAFCRFGFLETAHDTVDVAANVFDFTHEVADSEIAIFPQLIISFAA